MRIKVASLLDDNCSSISKKSNTSQMGLAAWDDAYLQNGRFGSAPPLEKAMSC